MCCYFADQECGEYSNLVAHALALFCACLVFFFALSSCLSPDYESERVIRLIYMHGFRPQALIRYQGLNDRTKSRYKWVSVVHCPGFRLITEQTIEFLLRYLGLLDLNSIGLLLYPGNLHNHQSPYLYVPTFKSFGFKQAQ